MKGCQKTDNYFQFSDSELRIKLRKELEIEKKTRTNCIISVLKVIYSVGLVFSNYNFFINKSSKGRKFVREKKYLLLQI